MHRKTSVVVLVRNDVFHVAALVTATGCPVQTSLVDKGDRPAS